MKVTDKLNMTMLCDFYELTMSNGYLTTVTVTVWSILTCFSEECPIRAALPLRPVCSS